MPDEPANVAESVALMGLSYIVLTSVNRDDLPMAAPRILRPACAPSASARPQTAVEALTPDFQGVLRDVETVVDSGLQVFAQNLETVRRLTHPVRDPRAGYDQTLAVLAHAKRHRPDVLTKSSLHAGPRRNRRRKSSQAMDDLRAAQVDILTLGQYLRPTVESPARGALRHAGAVRAVSRGGARARLPRMRFRPAGALELSRRTGARRQQRRARRSAP